MLLWVQGISGDGAVSSNRLATFARRNGQSREAARGLGKIPSKGPVFSYMHVVVGVGFTFRKCKREKMLLGRWAIETCSI